MPKKEKMKTTILLTQSHWKSACRITWKATRLRPADWNRNWIRRTLATAWEASSCDAGERMLLARTNTAELPAASNSRPAPRITNEVCSAVMAASTRNSA